MRFYLPFFCLLILACLTSCSNSNKQLKAQSEDTVLHTVETNNDTIISGYKYYLANTLREIKKQPWKKVVVDTVNDEFNKWIEVKFYYSTDEWIKIEAEGEDQVSAGSIETNSNYFLKESRIKIGDEIPKLILRGSVQFNFDAGKMGFSIGAYEIKAKCLDDITDLEYDRILEAREVQKQELLPDKIRACKVSSIRVLNVK